MYSEWYNYTIFRGEITVFLRWVACQPVTDYSAHVVKYLGRYVYRSAIWNGRLFVFYRYCPEHGFQLKYPYEIAALQ